MKTIYSQRILILMSVATGMAVGNSLALGNSLQDSGFEPGTAALVSFTAPLDGRWAAEDADLIVGPDNGVFPIRDGMIRLNPTGGSASQVSQWVDVSSLAAEIDAGRVTARFRALHNSPDPAASAGLSLNARTAIPGASLANALCPGHVIDADINTWEYCFVGYDSPFVLPVGTRAVEAQISFSNSSITLGGYADEGVLELTVAPLAGSGVIHLPEGQANLSVGMAGEIVVSNIGSSGEDGVTIQIGESDGFDFSISPAQPPDGTVLTISKIGQLNGVPDQLLITETTRIVGGETVLEPDFSPLGASTYTVVALNQGVVVAQRSGLTGAVITHDSGAGIFGNLFKPKKTQTSCPKWNKAFVQGPVQVTIQSAPPVMADAIMILGDGLAPTCGVDFTSEITILASGVASFTLGDERLSLFGQAHQALGQALFTAGAGNLSVSNIGSSGLDGVAIHVEDVDEFAAIWQPLDPLATVPDGAFLEFSATGSVGGMAEQALGTLRITDIGAELEITADYSAVGSTSHRLEVLDGGVLVTTVTGHTGPVARVVGWPKGCGKGRAVIDDFGTACYRPCWPGPVSINIIGGPTVVGDTLRVLAENPTAEFDFLSSFTTQAADIPNITIAVESASPAPCAGPTGDMNSDGSVDGGDVEFFVTSLLGAGTPSQLCDGDFNGSGNLDSGDVAGLVAALLAAI